MSKGIYIATTGPNSGKSIVTLGLMHVLLGKTARVGYFRPIVDDFPKGSMDNHIQTVIEHFEINLNYKNAYAFTRSEVIKKKNEGKEDEVVNKIIDKYKALEKNFDVLVVEGTDFSSESNIIEWDVNALIAKNLGIPAILLANAEGKNSDQVADNLHIALNSFQELGVTVLMAIANKVDPEKVKLYKSNLPDSKVLMETIPKSPILGQPTIKEIADHLNARILLGEAFLNNQVAHCSVGAMQLRNYLIHLKDNSLVITPGDRADILLGALQAHISSTYPSISGIVLTGGLVPEEPIWKLVEGLNTAVPILSVQEGTFRVTNQIGDIKPKMYAENTQKIEESKLIFSRHVRTEELLEKLITFEPKGITPRMFQYNLLERAKQKKKHIVLPEGYDERILRAAKLLVESDAVVLTLLGEKEKIKARLNALDIELNPEKLTIIDPVNSSDFEDYVQTLFQLRKQKGLNEAMARDLMADVSYFGTMMVYKGHAHGMVSGAVHTTQHTIRPALQFVKTKPGVSVVSSVFFMCLPDSVKVFGDCAINPNPNAQELAEIAISSAQTSLSFGIEPRIAMLSYSSGSSGQGEDVETVRRATEMVKELRPDLKVEGPIQYDAAVDMQVGQSKLPNSEVAGRASIFIFPDLNTGNNTYKAVQRETGALAIGPILQGLNKPVNDLSRGCTVQDIFNTVIITAIQAQEKED